MKLELDLLGSLPKTNRDIAARANKKDSIIIAIAKQFGAMYWDGPREYGYGGYRYDGRWQPVAQEIINHYELKPGMRVLDVGCGKGFLVNDLMMKCRGLEAFGLDISLYALLHAPLYKTIGRLHLGSAERLPFPENSFDLVVSINTLHNLPREKVIQALQEIERLAPGRGYVVVDSYRTEEEKRIFENWVLTAEFHGYSEDWLGVFAEAGYTGDYFFNIMEC